VCRLGVLAVLALSVTVSSTQSARPRESNRQTTGTSHDGNFTVLVQDQGGAALPNAWVRVQHWSFIDGTQEPKLIEDAVGTTDAKGEFDFKLPQGLYDVFVSAPELAPESSKCEIHKGIVTQKVFRLGIYVGTGQAWDTN